MPRGTIRYWAGARAAAGREEEPVVAETVGEALDQVARSHGPELSRVLTVASFLVDGVRADRSTPLAEGATVEVLPPFAGG